MLIAQSQNPSKSQGRVGVLVCYFLSPGSIQGVWFQQVVFNPGGEVCPNQNNRSEAKTNLCGAALL